MPTKCDRCFAPIKVGDLREMRFSEYNKDLTCFELDEVKTLCHDCYEIVKYASSPESWAYTALPDAKKHFYFDKK